MFWHKNEIWVTVILNLLSVYNNITKTVYQLKDKNYQMQKLATQSGTLIQGG